MKKIQKRHVTLIEMMIVMFLIALIAGAVAINMGGALDEGNAFKTVANIKNIENILGLRIAGDDDALANLESDWKKYILESPLSQNPKSLFKDGWGNEFTVQVTDNDFIVYSKKFEDYKRTTKTSFKD